MEALFNEYFEYRDGTLYWLKAPSLSVKAGDRAGKNLVTFKGAMYSVRRIVWLLNTGAWPERPITNVDGDKANNRFENLCYVKTAKARRIKKWKARSMMPTSPPVPQPVPVKNYSKL